MATPEKKTKEELKKEAEQLAAKLDEMNSQLAEFEKAEKARELAEMRARADREREQARLANIAKYQPVADEIVRRLHDKGFKSASIKPADKHHDNLPVINVLGTGKGDGSCEVSLERSYTRRDSDVRIIVGYGQGKHAFPRRKDGSYNYEKIVSTVMDNYEAMTAEQKRNATKNKNLSGSKAIAIGIMRKLSRLEKPVYSGHKPDPNNLYDYDSLNGVRLEATPYYPDKVKVVVDYHPTLTEKDALEFIKLVTTFKDRMDAKEQEKRNKKQAEADDEE